MAYMKDSTGRRLDTFKVASTESVASGVISNRLSPVGKDPLPPTTADQPTFTWGAAQTVNGRLTSPLSAEITVLGRTGNWNNSFGYLDVGAQYSGLDFFVDGDTVEIAWTEAQANGSRFWFWVDGLPVTAAPTAPGLSTTAGGNYWTKLVFPSAKRRRITLYTSSMKAWLAIGVPVTSTITATPPMLDIAIIGDSFCAGSSASPQLQAVAVTLGRLLGVNVINASTGGTGYEAGAETFGSAARIARATEQPPSAVVFIGSVNDPYTGTLQATAAATFAAYADALPGVPVIVFGPQPSNAADTISTNRAQAIQAVRAAALAAPNVSYFHDMVGMEAGSVPAAWSAATTYNDGDRVTYKGSVYQLKTPGGTSLNHTPGTNRRWGLETYMYTGTGKVGSVAGDGTRDVMLNADGIHPEIAGATALAIRIEAELRKDFTNLALNQ